MIDRRDLVFGAGCALALGVAEALRPRRMLQLLKPGRKLSATIPSQFGAWQLGEGGDIVMPQTPGSLASRLYSDRVARSYRRTVPDLQDVMLLIAYGQAQSDVLQLHRPEVCYPAVGFSIAMRRLVALPLGPGVAVPAVMLTATAGDRTEDILYWTRLGEALPQTAGDQRVARLETAMKGYVADGVLVRASAARTSEEPKFDVLTGFLRGLVQATPDSGRAALIGTSLAAALARG